MINEFYKDMTGKGSIIRQFFDYANKKGAEIGMENIYNFSIGILLFQFHRRLLIV